MEQLKLTENELLEIGFEKCKSIADGLNEEKTFFKIPTINGYFYYNQNDSIYTWYHKTIIGDASNDVHLDIDKKAELFVLLQCFKVKFNLIFLTRVDGEKIKENLEVDNRTLTKY